MKAKTILLAMLSLACFSVTAQVKKTTQKTKPVEVNRTAAKRSSVKDKSIRVKITTDSGIIIVKLYDSTPLHRDNFVKLVNQKFYDSLMFHRIIPDFMIQGGDPMSKNATAGSMLGMGGGDMARIPAEFRPYLFHKKGALAAARDGNPEKASSACQFYIVEGRVSNDKELDMIQQQKGIKFSPEQRQAYTTVGGTPFLDQDYTVFGEVVSGLEVIDKIINVPRDANNRPLGDVRMKMELLK
jgi:peptidyl-prolyl cis-trans isomerase B (cyclophilin B)